jgi:catalase
VKSDEYQKTVFEPKSQMAGTDTLDRGNTNVKLESLERFRDDATDQALRTNQGVKISDNQNTLKAGARGPSLLEDFIMREKITHFDHERIPERIVHARGTGAHGYFQTYEAHTALTKAGFLQDPARKPRYSRVFPRYRALVGRAIRCVTCAALP